VTDGTWRHDDGRIPSALVFAVVLAGLVAARWNVLASPLYEDQSVGFGREAEFLAQTRFDYLRLRYDEPHFLFGGTARSYMISAIPTILAALSLLAPDATTALVVWRLVGFAAAAAVVSLGYGLLRPRIGAAPALLSAAALLSTPMFLVQADLAGMELPMIAFAFASTAMLVGGRTTAAALFASLSFWMKASGALVGLVVLGALVVRRWKVREADRSRLTAGIACSVLLLTVQFVALWWGDDTATFRSTFAWPSAFRFPRVVLWCPDLFALAAVAAGLGAWRLYQAGPARAAMDLAGRFLAGEPGTVLGVVSAGVAAASLASMATYIFTPRYFILPLSFLYLLLPLLLFAERGGRKGATGFLAVVVALNLVNLKGALYPPVASVVGPDSEVLALFPPRSCAFSERSFEYLDDHASSVRMVRRIAQEHRDDSIFLDMPHWIYLTSPLVGYTETHPPRAFRADSFAAAAREFRDRALLAPAEENLLFLWSGRSKLRVPGPGEGVEILDQDDLTPPLALLRADRASLPRTPWELEEWYLDRTWAPDHALHRAIERFEFLRKTGRVQRAYEELHLARWLCRAQPDPQTDATLAALTANLEAALRTTATFAGEPWSLFADGGASASLEIDENTPAVKAAVGALPASGRVRLLGPRRLLRAGDAFEIRFRIRADRPARAQVGIERLFDPESAYPWREPLEVGPAWRDFAFERTAPEEEHDATLAFELLVAETAFEIADVHFAVGPRPRGAPASGEE
jgi:hypothetical protein